MYLFRPISLTIKPSLIIGFLSVMMGVSVLVGVVIKPPALLPSQATPFQFQDYRLADLDGAADQEKPVGKRRQTDIGQYDQDNDLQVISRDLAGTDQVSSDGIDNLRTSSDLASHLDVKKPDQRRTKPANIPTSMAVSEAVLTYALPKLNAANKPSDFAGFQVPAVMTQSLPKGLDALPVAQKKELFVRMLLPMILSANDEIIQHQLRLEKSLSAGANRQTSYLASLYGMKDFDPGNTADIIELRQRIQPIPVSLALAQAAIESGWGSSRFALQGNALFGQWAWKASAGLKPLEGSNSKAVVRSFPDLMSSVRAYMKNLNSHRAYGELRAMRAEILAEGRQPTGIELAIHLDNYAEIGQAYVQKLQTIISSNRFHYLEQVRLIK